MRSRPRWPSLPRWGLYSTHHIEHGGESDVHELPILQFTACARLRRSLLISKLPQQPCVGWLASEDLVAAAEPRKPAFSVTVSSIDSELLALLGKGSTSRLYSLRLQYNTPTWTRLSLSSPSARAQRQRVLLSLRPPANALTHGCATQTAVLQR